jgi:hypothetical protein
MISKLLEEFVAKADTHVVGAAPFGSSKEIIERNLAGTKFDRLEVKASFGMGRATAVPWIGFFGYDQRTEEGIYPVYLYFKAQKLLVLAFGVSETHRPTQNWSNINNPKNIREYFAEVGLPNPARYGDSLVHSVYRVEEGFNEGKVVNDLNDVVSKFHAIFENSETTNTEEKHGLIPAIVSAVNSEEIQNLINERAFYFQKGSDALAAFDSITASVDFIDALLKSYDKIPGPFNEKLATFPVDGDEYALLVSAGRLISYCDFNAANKNEYNDYSDKRTIAKSGAYQGAWVKNLLKYKKDNNQLNALSDSIGNAIAYLREPSSELTMLSEDHREMVSRKLLKHPQYQKESFVSQTIEFFQPYSLNPVNPLNLTRVISNILYHFPHVKDLWFEARETPPAPPPSPPEEEPRQAADKFAELTFSDPNRAILTAIRTKPFVLLAGLSGTGKSRLVRTLAYKTCSDPRLRENERKPGNFELISVKPNWHDSGELMGYVSRINEEKYLTSLFLRFVAKAWKYTHVPFFLCLDEMNLAPVEQYFAEYLSIIETRTARSGQIESDYLIAKSQFENPKLYDGLLLDLGLAEEGRFQNGIAIPENLIVVGTVNMDETTHSFSRKVLDRAMTFEMNKVNLNEGLDGSNEDWAYPSSYLEAQSAIGVFSAGSHVANQFPECQEVVDFLIKVNEILEGTAFKVAYRVRDEFLIYCYYAGRLASRPENWLEMALDEMTAMKILSRIEGDETKTGDVLTNLERMLSEDFTITRMKLSEMRDRLNESGYTSFWT